MQTHEDGCPAERGANGGEIAAPAARDLHHERHQGAGDDRGHDPDTIMTLSAPDPVAKARGLRRAPAGMGRASGALFARPARLWYAKTRSAVRRACADRRVSTCGEKPPTLACARCVEEAWRGIQRRLKSIRPPGR